MAFNTSKYVPALTSLICSHLRYKFLTTQNSYYSRICVGSERPVFCKDLVKLGVLSNFTTLNTVIQQCVNHQSTSSATLNDSDESDDESIQEKGQKHQNVQEELVLSIIREGKPLATSDWEKLKDKVHSTPGYVNKFNIDGIIMGMCITLKQFHVASSFLDYITASGKEANIATLSRFLKLCYVCHSDRVPDGLEGTIMSVYTKLKTLCPLMDANTAENAIHGLVLTQNWKEGLQLLTMIKITCAPSSSTYNVIIKAAFDHDDIDVGWVLMNEMLLKHRKPMPFVYHAWLDLCIKFDDQNRGVGNDMVKLLLSYFIDNDLRPTKDVAEKLRFWFKRVNPIWKGHMTTLNARGICKSCRDPLTPLKLTSKEFGVLRSSFFSEVMVGSNVFIKTTPEELQSFQRFVERTAPYNIVIDGLNVAYSARSSKSSPQMSQLLQSVVKHFVDKSQKVLVLGRKHMLSWPRKQMNYIHSHAKVFLAENISQDDPFLLYAAMHSGLGTCFISRDLMRGHSFLLKDPALKAVFRRWQQQHQYQVVYIAEDGDVKLKPPLSFNPSVQCSANGSWHIPYDEEYDPLPPQTFDPPSHWLCLGPKPETKPAE